MASATEESARAAGRLTRIFGDVRGRVGRAIDDVETWWTERKQARVLLIGIGETSSIHFPMDHFELGTLYLGNPVDRSEYYLASEFHHQTFEHKNAELMRLIAHLGATEITTYAEHGWQRTASGQLKAPLVKLPGELGGLFADRLRKTQVVERKRQLSPSEPRLPNGLHWYPHEQEWQDLAELRLVERVKGDSVHLIYRSSHGIDAKLVGGIGKLGFEVGGKFEEQVDTLWRVEARFDGPSA